nr:hypothetical protein [Nostoc sp. FACHB-145]
MAIVFWKPFHVSCRTGGRVRLNWNLGKGGCCWGIGEEGAIASFVKNRYRLVAYCSKRRNLLTVGNPSVTIT